jgi:hypothetical protein
VRGSPGGQGLQQGPAQGRGIAVAHRALHGHHGRDTAAHQPPGHTGQGPAGLPRGAVPPGGAARQDDEGHTAPARQGLLPERLGADRILFAVRVLQDQLARPGVAGEVEDMVAGLLQGLADALHTALFQDAHLRLAGAPPRWRRGCARAPPPCPGARRGRSAPRGCPPPPAPAGGREGRWPWPPPPAAAGGTERRGGAGSARCRRHRAGAGPPRANRPGPGR